MATSNFCCRLPKVELHAHLNGSLSLATLKELRELAAQNGEAIDEETWTDWKAKLSLNESCSLSECFKVFDIAHSLTQSTESIKISTMRVIEDFERDNVIYLELRSTLRSGLKMTKADYLKSMVEGVLEKRGVLGIVVRILVSINRSQSIESADENVSLALELSRMYPYHVIAGIDLSGDPRKGRFTDFSKLLCRARAEGLKITLHCGEVPNRVEISEMLRYGPERLGHATCVHEALGGGLDLWNELLEARVPVELCVTSNVKCETVPSVLQHHFQYFHTAKHPLTISTDDKGVFGTTMSREYQIVQKAFNLSEMQMWSISYNSIDHCFADNATKEKLKSTMLSWRKAHILNEDKP